MNIYGVCLRVWGNSNSVNAQQSVWYKYLPVVITGAVNKVLGYIYTSAGPNVLCSVQNYA